MLGSAFGLGGQESEAKLALELPNSAETSFNSLVTRYQVPIYCLVRRLLRDSNAAIDVTQRVFRKARRSGPTGSQEIWLYRISVRESSRHRSWSWRPSRQGSTTGARLADRSTAMDPRAVGRFLTGEPAELQQAVQEALDRVPYVFRTPLILRDLYGLSYEDVAKVLDAPQRTVKSRILRGRRALREMLDPMFSTRSGES
jgi:RNA polymerase sigma-70 factor, ECF subfamily